MSLSISNAKVDELLKSSNAGYKVAFSDVPMAKVSNLAPQYFSAFGTIDTTESQVMTAPGKDLMPLRHRIEASGKPLKNTHELDLEIDEMRGRGR